MGIGIDDYNALPGQTDLSDTVAVRLYTDEYNSGRNYKSTVGKRMVGLVDPNDVNCELKPETESVDAGAPTMPVEEIIIGWNGTCRATIQDLNPLTQVIGNGTENPLEDIQPGAPVVGATAAGTTVSKIVLAATQPFVKGDFIRIATTTGEPMLNRVKAVNAGVTELTLEWELDEAPVDASAVTKVIGYDLDLGGGASKAREFIFALDFGKGGKHRNVIYKAQPTGGFNRTMAKGKVKSMLDLKILGHAKPVTGLGTQVVPASQHVLYNQAQAA